MGKVMLVTSGKGGVGKSTVALNLAVSLSGEGKSTLVIELDGGLRCIDLMLSLDNIVYDLDDILSGRCSADEAVYRTDCCENMSIVAAPANACELDNEKFLKLCSYFSKKFDFVILDTPAGIGKALSAAAKASGSAVIVTTASPVSVRDAQRAAQFVFNEGVKKLRLVVNMLPLEIDGGNFPDIDEIIDKVSVQLVAIIPHDDVLKKTIPERTKKDKRKSVAVAAFSNMAKRLLGKDIPLLIR